jgi:glycosyltransferase involved in cell wall biosynthesis
MSMHPVVSIIICTYNRADHLRETLVSLAEVHVPSELPTELLVVDNASTDHTKQVVEACSISNMNVRYVYEPKRGKSNAYNLAFAVATGEILVSTDDDVRFPHDWIEKLVEPITSGKAHAAAGWCSDGATLSASLMGRLHKDWLLEYDFTQQKESGVLIGVNAAFSRAVLDKVPRFDTELGPGAIGFSDDVLFSWQIREAGFKIASAPIFVEHHFDASRLARASLMDRAIKEGHCTAYLRYHWLHSPVKNAAFKGLSKRVMLYMWRRLRASECRGEEGCREWELQLIHDVSFYQHYITESRRPRIYEKHGLVMLRHACKEFLATAPR